MPWSVLVQAGDTNLVHRHKSLSSSLRKHVVRFNTASSRRGFWGDRHWSSVAKQTVLVSWSIVREHKNPLQGSILVGKMACVPIPICIECGNTDNPCRCKIIGPTLGFIGFVVAAIIEWPLGALVWCCSHETGNRLFANPSMVVQPSISNCIPF